MGIFGDAVDWVGDAWNTVTGGVEDTFAGETVKDPNRDNFYLGGNKDTGGALRGRYGQQGDIYRKNATDAQLRGAPQANYGQANADYADQAQAREAQMAGANRLTEFAMRPQGPSAAQAQLQNATDQSMAANLALAGSGTGMGDSSEAMRRAQFANAGALATAANDSAMLRAQEDQAYRQQQMQGLGMAQDAYSGVRSGDMGSRGQSMDQAQFGVESELQNRGLNDAFTQGMVDASMGYDQMYYDTYQDELNAAQQYEAIRQGAATANAQQDQARDGQLLGMASSVAGLAMMSDRRAKTRVQELDDLNDSYAALSDEPANADDFKHAGWTQPGTEQHRLATMRDQDEAAKAEAFKRKKAEQERNRIQRIQSIQQIFGAAAAPLQR